MHSSSKKKAQSCISMLTQSTKTIWTHPSSGGNDVPLNCQLIALIVRQARVLHRIESLSRLTSETYSRLTGGIQIFQSEEGKKVLQVDLRTTDPDSEESVRCQSENLKTALGAMRDSLDGPRNYCSRTFSVVQISDTVLSILPKQNIICQPLCC